MTFEEMFQSAKAALSKASVKDANAAVAVQVNVTGDGSGIFYVKASDGVLAVEPYDYIDNDAVLNVDSAALLTALTKADTASLAFEGDAEKIAAFRTILETLPAPKKTVRKTAAKTTAAKKETAKTAAAKTETEKPASKTTKKAASSTKAAAAKTATTTKTAAAKAETTKTAAKTKTAKTDAAEKKTAAKTTRTTKK